MKNAKLFSLFFLSILIVTNQLILSQTKAEKIDSLLSKYYDYKMFNGAALAAENGKVLYKKGFGMANMEWNIPNTTDTKFRIGSMTKQFTAMLIMQLVEEGKLQLDVPVTTYIPDYPKDKGDKITIHHLLTHTSGIPNYTGLPSFADIVRNPVTPLELVKTFWDLPLEFQPGAEFRYSNSGYVLLGYIIEKVTGKTYEDLIKEKIFDPLGMKNSGYDHSEVVIPKRASGYYKGGTEYYNAPYIDMSTPFSAGALYSTVEDLYLWDQALYSDKLLSKEFLDKIFTPYSKPPFADAYGYGWGLIKKHLDNVEDSLKIETHGGTINGFNSIIVRITNDKDFIVLLNNTGVTNLSEMSDKIADILFDEPYEMPEKPLLLSFAELLNNKGIDEAADFYSKKIDEGEKIPDAQMNYLGYSYLTKKQYKEALEIFKLNIKAYPETSNPYDSYGEALLASGDTANAIINYKKSVELNPGNENGIKILKGLGIDMPASEPVVVDPKIYDTLIGKYELNPQFSLTVTKEDDKLFVQGTGQMRIELFPSSELEYYIKVVDARISFIKNDDGKVDKLILHQNGQNMIGKKIE